MNLQNAQEKLLKKYKERQNQIFNTWGMNNFNRNFKTFTKEYRTLQNFLNMEKNAFEKERKAMEKSPSKRKTKKTNTNSPSKTNTNELNDFNFNAKLFNNRFDSNLVLKN